MNKKQILSAAVLVLGAGFAACNSSRKMTAAGPKSDCNYASAGSATMNLTPQAAALISGTDLPKEYSVLKAENEKAFFAAAKKEGGTAAIQLPLGCRKFRLSLSETMSPQMAERYPDLVSLKGVSENGADLRLDWDGTSMRGQIIEAGKSFLLEPRTDVGAHVYILYNKDNATTPRRPFEKMVPPSNNRLERMKDVQR